MASTQPFVVGADLSSKKIALVAKSPVSPTVAAVTYDLGKTKTAAYDPHNAAEALYSMHAFLDQIDAMALQGSSRHAFIEAPNIPPGRGNVMGSLKQAYINGVVQAVFVQAGFTVEHVVVSTWKAKVVGHGRADKEDVLKYLRSVWPSAYKIARTDYDLGDAACIALFGQRKLAGTLA